MKTMEVTRYADMFAALGSEQRLQIVRLLLAAHPDGLIVGLASPARRCRTTWRS
jgi:hypothetical protein